MPLLNLDTLTPAWKARQMTMTNEMRTPEQRKAILTAQARKMSRAELADEIAFAQSQSTATPSAKCRAEMIDNIAIFQRELAGRS